MDSADTTGILGLPRKFSSFRNGQSGVMSSIYREFSDNQKKFMVAEMPTGTGKTFIAMSVGKLLDTSTIYVCTTKSLQDQFLGDFPYAKLIKGRSNYPCGRVPQKFPEVTAEDCLGDACLTGCAYAKAKEEARHSDLVVTNMAYFLTEIQHGKQFANRGYVVIDEADTLEDALLDQVSVQITQFDVEKMKLGAPLLKTKWEEWRSWAEEALKKVRLEEQAVAMDLRQYDQEESWATAPISLIREARSLGRLVGKMSFFLKHVDQYWVREESIAYTRTNNTKYWKWVFKPVRVDQFGDMVFLAGKKFLLMSATILDTRQYERNVGLAKYREEDTVGFIQVDSSFPKERRPIIIRKGIDLTYKVIETNLPKLGDTVKAIIDQHPNEKGLIHAVTYRIAKDLQAALGKRAIVHDSRNRSEVIQRFKESSAPLVLISPSVERGEDFPDDICRFIVIVKLPFPYLGDPRVNARLHHKDGQNWYSLKAVSKLIQMTGRGMRHELDSCTTYILDPGFSKLYNDPRTHRMFPKWWREALIREDLMKGGNSAEKEGAKNVQGQGQIPADLRRSETVLEEEEVSLQGSSNGSTPGTPGSPQGSRGEAASPGDSISALSPTAHTLQDVDDGGKDPGVPGKNQVLLGRDRRDSERRAAPHDPVIAPFQQRFHGKDGWPKS